MEPSPAECRRRAIEALRPDFLGALLAGLAATSPGLIAQVVSARFGRSFFMLLQDLSAMSAAPASPREMLLAWFQSGGAVTLAAGFVSWVLSPALMQAQLVSAATRRSANSPSAGIGVSHRGR